TSARPSSAWGVSVADTLQLSCLIYSSKHRYDNGKTVCEIQAPAAGDRTLLGGVCLVPFATGTGQVEFRISGVLAQKDGKWYAVQPRQVDATVQPAGRDGKLTPVGGGGKRDGNTPSGRRVIPSPFSQ
ncbi:MAG: hypothetical protein LBJ47_02605, partial [Tannerella sp.]|nr:hypothetical protein [Tannerella sp.]